jgi:hypothetical protein
VDSLRGRLIDEEIMPPQAQGQGQAPQPERATTEQLRHDIDTGRTYDKVSAPDPALCPLGTDEEAGGTPTSPEAVAWARRYETGRAERLARAKRRSTSWTATLLAAALIGGIVLLLWLLVRAMP